MSLALQLYPETVRTLGFASISGTYSGIQTPFDFPTKILFMQNLTDQTLMISWNGIDDHYPLAANSFLLLDVTANKVATQGSFIREGTRIYVRDMGTPPTSGAVYVTSFFGKV